MPGAKKETSQGHTASSGQTAKIAEATKTKRAKCTAQAPLISRHRRVIDGYLLVILSEFFLDDRKRATIA
jgi:hypothetical protein